MTIRFRLTLIFSILFIILLGVLRVTSFNYMDKLLSQYFKGRLNDRVSLVANIAFHSDDMSTKMLKPFASELEHSLPYEQDAVLDMENKPIFVHGLPMPPLEESIKKDVLARGSLNFEQADTQYILIRYFNEGKQYIVAVGACDVRRVETEHQFMTFLLVSFLISVLLVIVLGWWFSGKAMSPIRAITRRARDISGTDLDVRLGEGNGKDELAELAHAFNDMFDRLKASFESQKQFIANTSHELRTPLTALEGHLDVALLNPRTEEQYVLVLKTALGETRRLQRVMNQLLLLARAETEFIDSPMQLLSIDDVLFSVLDNLHMRYPRRKFDLKFEVILEQENSMSIVGNTDLLRIAFSNVIENAMKYSSDDSPVLITVRRENGRIIFLFRDWGIGINPDELKHIFRPFYRGENVSGIYGHGIGLALVSSIVQHHNGSIAVDSTPESGTLITLSFPAAQSENN